MKLENMLKQFKKWSKVLRSYLKSINFHKTSSSQSTPFCYLSVIPLLSESYFNGETDDAKLDEYLTSL